MLIDKKTNKKEIPEVDDFMSRSWFINNKLDETRGRGNFDYLELKKILNNYHIFLKKKSYLK